MGELESCPNCGFVLLAKSTYCPVCGLELTYPIWKKLGAWILLILIFYGMIKCHVSILDGFD